MNLKKTIGLCALLSGFVVTSALDAVASSRPSAVLVIPARQRIVKLAFEIARLKDVCLVSYSSSLTQQSTLIHVWNGEKWEPIDTDAYAAGSFMSGEPKTLIVIGDSTTLPAQLAGEPSWCRNVHKTAKLDTASLVNELGGILKFESGDWEWIAAREGLKLTDRNEERRRYGRWGAPGKEQESRMLPSEEGAVMPPAAPIAAPITDLKTAPCECDMPKVEAKPENKAPVPPKPPEIVPPKPAAPQPQDK